MLPKNKLRNARLSRLKIFDGENGGPFMQNVVRRYDAIPIAPKKTSSSTETQLETIEEETTKTNVTRQDDTPPLGTLGGRLPRVQFTPKVKPKKIKKKAPSPGQMKIFDSQGREWGRQKWKEASKRAAV